MKTPDIQKHNQESFDNITVKELEILCKETHMYSYGEPYLFAILKEHVNDFRNYKYMLIGFYSDGSIIMTGFTSSRRFRNKLEQFKISDAILIASFIVEIV